MPHFLIKTTDVKNNKITISDKDLYKHIIKVMRTKCGEKLLFLDENEIQYETKISEIENTFFVCEIEKQYKSERKLPLNLYIAQSVLNSDAQTSAIQKSTELGVKGIIPLYTDNCAVKESVIKNKIEKWQKVALESVKQCERADIPTVFDVAKIEDVVKNYEQIIVFAERDAQSDFFTYAKENKIDKTKSILVIIGPEGGFSKDEVDALVKEGFYCVSLGERILRAETAAISVVNATRYEFD
jgi:16S rRNA (uracil1498-N3)-methyltransferase